MKQLLYFVFCLQFSAFGQCDSLDVVIPDVDAEFPGGAIELRKFVQKNIEYPQIERYACHQPTGRVYLQFNVCVDGSIHDISILRSSKNDEIDQIGINLIKKMPNWIPGKVNDLPVVSKVRFPITIELF